MQLVNAPSSIKDEITLSIIVPVYNEQEMLPIFHHDLAKVLSTLSTEHFEIIYINDGSDDDSWDVMLNLSSHYANIECLNLSRNFGKEAAMTAGIDSANGQAVILLDADLQDPPELIPEMLLAWREGFDVVNMKRSARLGESKFKCWTAHMYYRLLDYLSDVPIQKDVGDFRLVSKRVIEDIKQLPERNRYMKGILSWPGYKQTTISFERPERIAGESKWSFIQLVKLGMSGITAFSVKPLRISTWAGAFISLSAFIYGFWIVLKTLVFGEAVAGYPSMMLIMLFLGGVQLLAIGVLGEYIGRIYGEVKARPIYLLMDKQSNNTVRSMVKKHG
tara:strand:- start:99865 stop:100863 length:999 start_codon:yes stop_codon:yes gene_type:complete